MHILVDNLPSKPLQGVMTNNLTLINRQILTRNATDTLFSFLLTLQAFSIACKSLTILTAKSAPYFKRTNQYYESVRF